MRGLRAYAAALAPARSRPAPHVGWAKLHLLHLKVKLHLPLLQPAAPALVPVVAAPASVPVVGVVVIAFPVPDPPLVPHKGPDKNKYFSSRVSKIILEP